MKLWRIALAVFLILYGLLLLTNIKFELQNFLLGIVALAAAVLLLFDK